MVTLAATKLCGNLVSTPSSVADIQSCSQPRRAVHSVSGRQFSLKKPNIQIMHSVREKMLKNAEIFFTCRDGGVQVHVNLYIRRSMKRFVSAIFLQSSLHYEVYPGLLANNLFMNIVQSKTSNGGVFITPPGVLGIAWRPEITSHNCPCLSRTQQHPTQGESGEERKRTQHLLCLAAPHADIHVCSGSFMASNACRA